MTNYQHTKQLIGWLPRDEGTNSVMGLKNKEQNRTWRTQTLFSALSRVLHTDLDEFVNVFCVFCRDTWIESRKDDEAAAASLRFPVTKSFLGQTSSRDLLLKLGSTLAADASKISKKTAGDFYRLADRKNKQKT